MNINALDWNLESFNKELPKLDSVKTFFYFVKRYLNPSLEGLSNHIYLTVQQKGYALIKNLPIDSISGNRATKTTNLSEAILASLTSKFGVPYGYSTQRNGVVIQNITPDFYTSNEIQSGTNLNFLGWHTEDAALRYNCDFIALICIRNDTETKTSICNYDILNFPSEIESALRSFEFNINPDGQYLTYQKNPRPILTVKNGKKIYRVDIDFTIPITNRAKEAFSYLIEAANRTKIDFQLVPGDLLIFDNRICIHSRTVIKYQHQDQLRWLQRLMLFEKYIPKEIINPLAMNIYLTK